MKKDINIIEHTLDNVIATILEYEIENITDIKFKNRGHENSYEFPELKDKYQIETKEYSYLLKDCTYNYLVENIDSIFEPYIYYLNMINMLPESYPTLKDIDDAELYVYYGGCRLYEDKLIFELGLHIRTGEIEW